MTGAIAGEIGSIFVSVIPSLAGAMDAIKAGAGDAADAFATGFGEGTKDKLSNAFKEMPKEQADAFKGFGGEAAKTFIGAFSDLTKGEMPNMLQAFDVFEEGVFGVVDATVGKIPLIGGALRSLKGDFDTFQSVGSQWMDMMTEIGDSYLEMSRKLAGTTTDPGQVTGELKDVRDILASGAIVDADSLAETLGRVASNLKGLDTSQLKEVATTLSEAKELVGNFDDTKVIGVLNAFNVSGDQANQVLVQMTNVSRQTHASLDLIAQVATTAGASMRLLGFDVTQSTSLIGQLVQQGEPVARIASTFNDAVKNFTKAGIDPAKGFKEVLASIQALSAAGDQQGALGLVEKYLGVRSPAMLEEINKGLITVAANGQLVVRGIDGIDAPLGEALEQTMTLGQAFERVGHQIQAAFAPTGTVVAQAFVKAGDAISAWVRDNQAKLIRFGAGLTDVFLRAFADIAKIVGGTLKDFAPFVNAFKDMFIFALKAIDLAFQSVFSGLSHLPSWLGGDAFKDVARGLADAGAGLDKALSTNLTDPLRKAGDAADHLADVTLPHLAHQVASTAQQMAGQADLEKALSENVNGENKDAFSLVPGATPGPLGQGQVLLDPNTMADTKAKLAALGIEVTTDASGVVTQVIDDSKHEWADWWKDQKDHPPEAPVTITPQTADGSDITDTSDLVKAGVQTLTINGVPTPVPTVPSPGSPAPVGTQFPVPPIPTGPGMTPGAPMSGIQAQLSTALSAMGLSPGEIQGILAMNQVEGGATDPKSLLGFNESQAQGPQAHVDAFKKQWDDPSRRGPGGSIPGVDAGGNITDPVSYLTWIRTKIVGQNDAPGQPPHEDYQQRLIAAYQTLAGSSLGVPAPGAVAPPAVPGAAPPGAPTPGGLPGASVTYTPDWMLAHGYAPIFDKSPSDAGGAATPGEIPASVQALAAQYGLTATDHGDHTLHGGQPGQGNTTDPHASWAFDFSGSVDKEQAFADAMKGYAGQIVQEIWQNPQTGQQTGIAGGQLLGQGQYYTGSDGYSAHTDHVHVAFTAIPGAGAPVVTSNDATVSAGSPGTFSGVPDASGSSTIGPGGPIAQGYNNPWTNPPVGLTPRQSQDYTSSYEEWQERQTTTAQAITTAGTALTTAMQDQTTAATENTALQTQYNNELAKWNAKAPSISADLVATDTDYVELQKTTAKLSDSNKKLGDANDRVRTSTDALGHARDEQTIDAGKPPPKPPGEDKKDKGDKNAEDLGKGFIGGLMQELGFPDVFGKGIQDWGITKLLTGGLGFGAGLLANMGQVPTGLYAPGQPLANLAGQTPSDDSSGGQSSSGSGLLGFVEGLFPGLKNSLGPKRDGDSGPALGTPGAPPLNVSMTNPFNGPLGPPPGPPPTPFAEGDFLPEGAVIQPPVSPAGKVVWAEPKTGGEAFIPLAGGERSKQIWAQTGQALGITDPNTVRGQVGGDGGEGPIGGGSSGTDSMQTALDSTKGGAGPGQAFSAAMAGAGLAMNAIAQDSSEAYGVANHKFPSAPLDTDVLSAQADQYQATRMNQAMAPAKQAKEAEAAPHGSNGNGNTLTVHNHNDGIMSPPQANDTIRNAAYTTSAPQLVGGGGLPS